MIKKATQKDAYKLLHKGILALEQAEGNGLRINLHYCQKAQKQLTKEIKGLEEKIYKSKFYRHWKHTRGGRKPNINSNQQLGNFLYKKKGLEPYKRTPSGEGSTDEESLKALNIKEIKIILKVRKLKKIRDTYLKGFIKEQVDGFIHPHFNLHIARTYRSSSNAPNFQNLPKRDKKAQKIVRQALYPRKGHQLLEVDYSGAEVIASCCYHKDPVMIKYVKDENSDMHGDMAGQIFQINNFDRTKGNYNTLRSAAKSGFVFPQFYGDYYGNNAVSLACSWGGMPEKGQWKKGQGIEIEKGYTLGDHLVKKGFRSLKSFANHIKKVEDNFWNSRFKVYGQWKKDQWRRYQAQGYIEMLTGFRCKGPMSENDTTNYPIQGTAFHFLLWSFIQINKYLQKENMDSRLVGQIHDSIVMDIYPPELEKVEKVLKYVMINKIQDKWPWIIVPLEADIDLGGIDQSWYNLKSYKTLK